MQKGYIDRIITRVDKYHTKYKKHPVVMFFKIVGYSILYPINNIKICNRKLKNKSKNTIYIGIRVGGGLGDLLISANYILYLQKYLDGLKIQTDVYASNFSVAQSVFANSNIVNNLYKNHGYINKKGYDIFLSIVEPFPAVEMANINKLKTLSPKLLQLVKKYDDYENKNKKIYLYNHTKALGYITSMINNRNRVQLNDVGSLLRIEPILKYQVSITVDETQTLKKFNLDNKKFITLNRGVSEHNKFWNSTKMWPIEYFEQLTRKLKQNYPEYTIIQVGHSTERNPQISGVASSLVGKTSLEELKVILKHSFLHIDGEGGMVHLRHSLRGGTSIVMFGPTSKDFYGYPENINLSSNACPFCCDWINENWQTYCINENNKHICMKKLLPETVFEKAEKILANGV